MSASTPIVARDTNQRRTNHKIASSMPTASAAVPSRHRPAWSRWAIGPSMTALVNNGMAIVAPTLMIATTNIAIHRTR